MSFHTYAMSIPRLNFSVNRVTDPVWANSATTVRMVRIVVWLACAVTVVAAESRPSLSEELVGPLGVNQLHYHELDRGVGLSREKG